MRAVYRVDLPWDDVAYFSADLAEGSARIYTLHSDSDDPDDRTITQWQTADARHCPTAAAMLVCVCSEDIAAVAASQRIGSDEARSWIESQIEVE